MHKSKETEIKASRLQLHVGQSRYFSNNTSGREVVKIIMLLPGPYPPTIFKNILCLFTKICKLKCNTTSDPLKLFYPFAAMFSKGLFPCCDKTPEGSRGTDPYGEIHFARCCTTVKQKTELISMAYH